MAVTKNKTVFICSECGYETSKWYGKCPDCGAWNTLTEQVRQQVSSNKAKAAAAGTSVPVHAARLSEISSDDSQRYKTGVDELDRVLGGGIVPGSVMLLSGDPGIGRCV